MLGAIVLLVAPSSALIAPLPSKAHSMCSALSCAMCASSADSAKPCLPLAGTELKYTPAHTRHYLRVLQRKIRIEHGKVQRFLEREDCALEMVAALDPMSLPSPQLNAVDPTLRARQHAIRLQYERTQRHYEERCERSRQLRAESEKLIEVLEEQLGVVMRRLDQPASA